MLPHDPLPELQSRIRPSASVDSVDSVTPEGYVILDRALRFVEVNDAFAMLYNMSVAADLGRTVAEALPTLAPSLEPLLQQVLETGLPIEHVEFSGTTGAPVSTRRRLLMSFYPVRARSGFVLGVEMVTQELHRDRAVTPVDHDMAGVSQLIFNQAPIGIMLADRDGALRDVNPSICTITGYTREELLGMCALDLTHPDDRQADQRLVAQIFAGHERDAPVELRYIHKEGREIWVRVTHRLVSDVIGNMPLRLVFVEDITDQRVVREQLRSGESAARRSEAKFAAAFKAGPIILTITRLANGQFVEVNESFVSLTGYTREETLGRTPLELGVWVAPALRAEGLLQIREGQPIRGVETNFRLKNGDVRTCLLAADMIEVDGEPCVLTALTDITTRKQAEVALERYHLLSEHTRDIVLFIRKDGQIVVANAAAVAAYGYDHATLLSKRVHDLRDPSTVSLLQLNMTLADGGPVLFETVHRRKDGSTFPVEVSSVGADIGGERLLLSIIRDISDRVQAEAERNRLLAQLRQERAQLEAVLHQLPVGVMIAEAPTGKLVLGNEQAEAIWRHSFIASDDISNYDAYRGFHPQGQPYQPEEWPIARALATGELVQHERIVIQRGDETYGTIEVSATPIRDEAGAIRAAVVIFQDVTAQERSSQALLFLVEASAWLTSSLDYDVTLGTIARLAVPLLADWCLVHLIDLDGIARVVAFEHAEPDQHMLVSKLQHQYILDHNPDSPTAQVLRSGESLLVEEISDEYLQAIAADEDHLALLRQMGMRSGIIVPLVIDGERVGALTLIAGRSGRRYDQIDLLLAEEMARRAAQAIVHARLFADEQQARAAAEAAVRLRDEFLSVASHELKTPLTALLGNAEMVQRRDLRNASLSERDRRSVATVVTQARRLNRLIAALLDVTRITAGQLALNLAPVDLSELVRDLVEEARSTATIHQFTSTLPEESVVIMGDVLRLEQVIANLLQNALKYSPDGGTITVDLKKSESVVILDIIDQGIGIPAAALPHLFTRYYRAPNTETLRIPGMGIGLYVVKEIVELHGGQMSVTSEEGRGSTFTVTLPVGVPEQVR